MVHKGIEDYNKCIKPDNKCKTIQDVQKDFSTDVNMTFTDTLGSMQDRGLMVMIKELLGIDNAYDFLVKMGVETDG
mgnify:CR=1 FL=1